MALLRSADSFWSGAINMSRLRREERANRLGCLHSWRREMFIATAQIDIVAPQRSAMSIAVDRLIIVFTPEE